MKKQILALSLGLMTIGAFAQKNELKAVYKAIKKKDFTTAKATILTLESMEGTMDAKYKAKYYYLKGATYSNSNVQKAADAYNKLFEVEKEIGKTKYTKLAQPKLQTLIETVSKKALNAYNKEKDYKTATENFYLTYVLSPNDTAFLYNAAVSATQSKEFDKSLEYFQKLKEIGYTGITNQYFATSKEGNEDPFPGKLSRDIAVKTGSHSNPVDKASESKKADIIKRIGMVYVSQGKPELAIAALQEARKDNPKDLSLILNQADMYIQLKRMDKFGELMKEAAEIDPTNPILFYNLGIINANQNKLEEAIVNYEKAIELKPDYRDAYLNLGIILINKRVSVVDEMNNNLSDNKIYNELEGKLKVIYKNALPYFIKADELKRDFDSVKNLLNIYDSLEMEAEGDALRPIYKELRGK
jgi:tetratricopeptide (TPR) repeat protein